MSDKQIRDVSASIRYRLLAIARERQEHFQFILTMFALERLLYRISMSPYHDRFVLKGAMLFGYWTNQLHRMTQDLDLLSRSSDAVTELEQVFWEISSTQVEDDGLSFIANSVRGEEIREGQEYGGIRIHMEAILGKARIPLQIDIGFGDAITPRAEEIIFPTILDLPAPRITAYSRETVIAEKFEAMVRLGIGNSRMKDFYDLWILARNFSFNGLTLSEAFSATFSRRNTGIPNDVPLALLPAFSQDGVKQMQWQGFANKAKLVKDNLTLEEVTTLLHSFLIPPALHAAKEEPFRMSWYAPGPWT